MTDKTPTDNTELRTALKAELPDPKDMRNVSYVALVDNLEALFSKTLEKSVVDNREAQVMGRIDEVSLMLQRRNKHLPIGKEYLKRRHSELTDNFKALKPPTGEIL